MFNDIKKERIYKNTHLNPSMVSRVRPIFESTFKQELSNMNIPGRKKLIEERARFGAEQYANRVRIANNMNKHPLHEDASIFGGLGLKNLFESVSTPGNIIGNGNVSNPDSSWQHNGGIWNSDYKSGSGDLPTYVFGLQSHLALHCYGFDMIPTIAVDTPKVVLNYVDTVYGGGTFDDADNHPSFVELSNNVFTGTWIKTNSLKRSVTELIIRSADAASSPAMKVLFIVGSSVKPAITVQILSTGTVEAAGDGHAYTASTTLSVKDVVDAIGASITTKIVFGSAPTVTAVTGGITIDYASATRTNIIEASTNDGSGKPMTRAQHRKGPKHKLNVISFDKQVEIEGFEIEADTDNIQIKDMAAMGINVISRLYNGVQNQLIQSIDETILNHLYALGVQHAVNAYKSQGVNHSLFIDVPATTNIAVNSIDVEYNDILGNDARSDMGSITNSLKSAAYENQMTHMDRLYGRLLVVAEFIAQQNRIGGPDFMVAGGYLMAAIKKHSTYTASPIPNTITVMPQLHYSGTIFETISLYKNPRVAFNDQRILLGRRGDDTDPGAKFLAYDLAASRQTLAEDTMAEKIRVWSRFKIVDVGFYPELNYYTMIAINGYNWA